MKSITNDELITRRSSFPSFYFRRRNDEAKGEREPEGAGIAACDRLQLEKRETDEKKEARRRYLHRREKNVDRSSATDSKTFVEFFKKKRKNILHLFELRHNRHIRIQRTINPRYIFVKITRIIKFNPSLSLYKTLVQNFSIEKFKRSTFTH